MNKAGINRANNPVSVYISNESNSKGNSPCIFLSHRSIDKPIVRKISEYISKAGIDYYFDENDADLQNADQSGNDEKVMQCIKTGIDCSTHFLSILTENALSSLWMPYEIGYGDRAEKIVSCLKIKGIDSNRLTSFYKTRDCIMGLSELNTYLEKIVVPYGGLFFNKISVLKEEVEISQYDAKPYDVIMKTYNSDHPLYDVVDK